MARQLLDLLYPENRAQRVAEIREYFLADTPTLPETFHRVTLFLTFRCNLRCRYCNTILPNPGDRPWPAKKRDLELSTFKRMIDGLAPHRLQHLHLTGGEVTLVRGLREMISHAASRGIPCSITTNGTAAPGLYRDLVSAGLREIRISCDAHDPGEYDRIVGRKGCYERVAGSVRELVRLRDEEQEDIHIILNMCVGYENREKIVEAVKRSIALRPDDVKLIAISNERLGLGAFSDKTRIIERLEEHLADFPPERFPLLRRKISSVFSQETYGLEDLTSKKLMQNCFVPLTERVCDAEYYYPCPVYVREGGAPLGRIEEDDLEAQQRKSVEFSRGTSCLTDPVCLKSCIYCCRKFNQHANAEIHKRVMQPSGAFEPLSLTTRFDGIFSNAEILRTMRGIDAERKGFSRNVPQVPFLVIKPSGWPRRDAIRERIARHTGRIKATRQIEDWNDLALRLYSDPLTDARVYRGLLLKRVLPDVEGTSRAEVVFLAGEYSFQDLADLKRQLRAELPPMHCLILHGEDLMVTTPGYIHSPDEGSYWIEANLILDRSQLKPS